MPQLVTLRVDDTEYIKIIEKQILETWQPYLHPITPGHLQKVLFSTTHVRTEKLYVVTKVKFDHFQ